MWILGSNQVQVLTTSTLPTKLSPCPENDFYKDRGSCGVTTSCSVLTCFQRVPCDKLGTMAYVQSWQSGLRQEDHEIMRLCLKKKEESVLCCQKLSHARTVIPVFLLTAFQALFHTVHMVVEGAQQTDSFSSSISVLVTQQRYFSLFACLLTCFETHVTLFGLKLHSNLSKVARLALNIWFASTSTFWVLGLQVWIIMPGLCGTSI